MREILENNGYKFVGTCNCHGLTKSKFRKGNVLFRIHQPTNRWWLEIHGHAKSNGPKDTLQTAIDEVLTNPMA